MIAAPSVDTVCSRELAGGELDGSARVGIASSRSGVARASSSASTTSWRTQRGATVSREAVAAARSPIASCTRAWLIPRQNESSTWSAHRRAASWSPPASAITVPTRATHPRTSVPSDSASTIASVVAKTCRAVSASPRSRWAWASSHMARARQKTIVSAGASAMAPSSAIACGRSPSSRCDSASATANSARMIVMSATGASVRTAAAMRSASSGRPANAWPRARVASNAMRRSGSRLRATVDLADLVGGVVPRLRQGHRACDPVGREPAEWIVPARRAQIAQHLPVQRPALDPAAADVRGRGPHEAHVHARSVDADMSAHDVNCSTSSTKRRRSTRRWHHAKSTIESTSLTATDAGIAAIVRLIVASRPLS